MEFKHLLFTASIALGLMILLSHCGSSTSGAKNASCTYTAQNVCYDFTGSGFSTSAASTAQCTEFGAGYTYSASACPTANRLASCTQASGQAGEFIMRFYTGGTSPYTQASQAQSVCTTVSGTFKAG